MTAQTYSQALAQAHSNLHDAQTQFKAYKGHQYGANVDQAQRQLDALVAERGKQGNTYGTYDLQSDGTVHFTPVTKTPIGTVPPAATPPTAAVTGPADDKVVAANQAQAQFTSYLLSLGFDPNTAASLAQFGWQEFIDGKSGDEINLDIQQQPVFKQTFGVIDQLRKAGKPAPSPAEVLAYRKQGTELAQQYGLPKGFYDQPQDFDPFILNNVSATELAQRFSERSKLIYSLPPEVSEVLRTQGGLGNGDLTALFLDPAKALPLLEQKLTAAQAVYDTQKAGYGLTFDQATQAVLNGQTPDQLGARADQAVRAQELFQPLPGQPGTSIDETGFVQGDPAAARALQKTAAQRTAAFQGGGGLTTTGQGVKGAGTAS